MTSSLVIEALKPETEATWETYVAQHPEAGIYHRLWWRDVFRRSFGYEPHFLIAKRGADLVGVMPLYKTPTLRGTLWTSIPFRDRAAPLADDDAALSALLAEAARLTEVGGGSLLVKSVGPLDLKPPLAQVFSTSADWIRSVTSLPATREDYRKRLNDKTRNMIRQAENSDLAFSLVGSDPARIRETIAVLKGTQHRLGIPPFPERFYLDIVDALMRDGCGEVGAVTHRGRVMAAAILLFEKNSAVYAYAGSLPESWPLRANDFLVWNAAVTAIERGKTAFDFGSDSSQQDGLLFFKKKWGAEGRPLHYYALSPGKNKPPAWRDSSQGLYPMLRSVVRNLPRPFYEWTGILTRYFG